MVNTNVPEYFGCMVFNDTVMRQRLPKDTYKALKKTMDDGRSLNPAVAAVVANAMKDWALEKGATHYTHWFQPMTGMTAEKHDSFISPLSNGHVIMEFSGKELIQGEPDASSFPSGGLRATFEARGYTAWDATSFAFIKDNTLCIPTAFYSFTGEALDEKTPLLRSMEAIGRQTKRILALFGHPESTRVITTVGPEQEYFLVDKALVQRRKDLIFCGRTLFGAKPPKGQEMDDHYFGALRPQVSAFMHELDEELWKLGILAKTEHNEAAPAQHELAPIFTTTNIASDHNQLTMEVMKRVADKHGLVCILHEKPFAGVNGSGKHNNWSLATNTGINLLEPGDSPQENAQFLLFLSAVIKAVDDHQGLLRSCVATAGNDHRLGGAEAPPAIVSMFLGDELFGILESIEKGTTWNEQEKVMMRIGVHTLPRFARDTTDRNRTSPFAFTGNKFEFRMLGSSLSVSGPNTVLNTIVADTLEQFADRLENCEDFNSELTALIAETVRNHKRIIFNGNNYTAEWEAEAKRRGLLNWRSVPEALAHWTDEKNVALFEKHKVYSAIEMTARREIMLENYCKTLNIESMTLQEMIRRDMLPAVNSYMKDLGASAVSKQQLGLAWDTENELLTRLSELYEKLYHGCRELEKVTGEVAALNNMLERAVSCREKVFTSLQALRVVIDELESLVGNAYWPYPTYSRLLFSV